MSKLFNKSHGYMCKSLFLLLLIILVQLTTTPAFSQNWVYRILEEGKSTTMNAVNGNKIFIYSGLKRDAGGDLTRVNQMEIFDVATDEKEVVNLPTGAESFSGTTGVSGSKIYFGGGSANAGVTKQVYVYDTVAKTWNVTYLSLDRMNLAATAVNGYVFFGGGIAILREV